VRATKANGGTRDPAARQQLSFSGKNAAGSNSENIRPRLADTHGAVDRAVRVTAFRARFQKLPIAVPVSTFRRVRQR
jgi:hypothetical protein